MKYHPKTVSVRWDAEAIAQRDSCWRDIRYFDVFAMKLDKAALEAEQVAVFERYRSQLSNRAILWPSPLYGCFNYAPIEAAQEMYDVVRKYFTLALERMPASDEALYDLHRAVWRTNLVVAK
jgi:hypothetical protein